MAFFFTDDKTIADGYAKIARPKFIDELRKRAERLDNRAAFSALESAWKEAEEAQAEYEDAELAYDGEGNVLPLYLNITNPLVHDFNGEEYREITFAELIQKARSEGRDGTIFKNTYDSATQDYNPITDIYVVFSSEQIKSADPITYDNNGNVIPLSERFNSGNEDIRFSIPDDQAELQNKFDSGEITEDEYKEATQENWESAVKKYGAFKPEAETPTPKSVDGEKSVTRVVNNILNHAALTEEQFNTLEIETLMNEMSHEVFGDEKAVQNAENAYKKGIAVEKWDKARTSAKYISKDDIAVGVLLLKKTIEDKKYSKVYGSCYRIKRSRNKGRAACSGLLPDKQNERHRKVDDLAKNG